MKTYKRELDGPYDYLFCGHWNDSPIEIGMPLELLKEIPEAEIHHYHNYHEYYVVLEGEADLNVEGNTVKFEPGKVVMVEPGEAHSITWVHPEKGCRWVIIKEKSEPNSKHIASE